MLSKAIINLRNLEKNAQAVKEKLNRNAKFCAVVKADGYGHGIERVANALYKRVDLFAVALVKEGESLRNAGIDKEILVLIPVREKELPFAVKNRLTLTVDNPYQLYSINAEGFRQGKRVKVHVKVDTGMNRLGCDYNCLKDILRVARQLLFVEICGCYSHFANPQNKKERYIAENKFLLANNLVKGYNNKAICHISASGGFLRGVQGDMVRIGLLLYGYTPFESDLLNLLPVMSVYAPVIEQRHAQKNQTVLYGDFRVNKGVDYSLIRYGYADGLPKRTTGNMLNDRCMDITAVKGVYSNYYPVMTNANAVAKKHGTISYEILVNCAKRAQKIYIT